MNVAALLLVNLFMKGEPADSWAIVVGVPFAVCRTFLYICLVVYFAL